MAYPCLETMMFDAAKELKEATERFLDIEKRFFSYDGKENLTEIAKKVIECKKDVSNKTERYNDLLIAKRIFKEMEKKGIEL